MKPRTKELKTIAVAAGIGCISGAIAYFVYTVTAPGREGSGNMVLLWFWYLSAGIVFGGTLCLYLLLVRQIAILRSVVLLPLVILSWYAAGQATVFARQAIGLSDFEGWLEGAISGSVNAFGVAVALALVIPSHRRVSLILTIVVVGAVFGLPFGLPLRMWPYLAYFVFWHTGVMACIGWAVTRSMSNAEPLKAYRL